MQVRNTKWGGSCFDEWASENEEQISEWDHLPHVLRTEHHSMPELIICISHRTVSLMLSISFVFSSLIKQKHMLYIHTVMAINQVLGLGKSYQF